MRRSPTPWRGRQPATPPSGGRGGGRWLIAAAIALTALIAFLAWRFPDALAMRGDKVSLVYYLMFIGLIGGAVVLRVRGRPGLALRQAGIWAAIALVLMLGYSFRTELVDLKNRLTGELLPHRGTPTAEDAVAFRARADGHFHVEARVDGRPIRFLVDTGASQVVLSPDDARRLGFDPENLSYTRILHTANGLGRGAPVTLNAIVVGPIRVENLAAIVNQAAMGQSLLGMSYLERLSGFEVRKDTLKLWP